MIIQLLLEKQKLLELEIQQLKNRIKFYEFLESCEKMPNPEYTDEEKAFLDEISSL